METKREKMIRVLALKGLPDAEITRRVNEAFPEKETKPEKETAHKSDPDQDFLDSEE